ncbi:glycosyltransferase family 4 protein [Flavihumibacter fluvii]|uniref:glycosyltransferase family 4 protein n=1 Tax=Flavihumibacter fluvii TaxID=2838157 RepID=UPI001BDE7B84|nr:glycosyltransferase family 1 protein [Flavihumibacter fluvii]ULQ52403.1 glycosyltransferase family 4 protein [Flavihumibacter fluvii]
MISLIYRKANTSSFSLEKVFNNLVPYIRQRMPVNVYQAYTRAAGLKGVLTNLRHFSGIKSDVYHVTGDIHYAVFAFPRRKTILTIHDCVFLYQHAGIKRLLFRWLWLKLPVWWATRITTISEKSKEEIVKNSGCRPEKIVVINNPVDDRFQFVEKEFNAAKPAILFIGTKPNKNLPNAIEAIKGINCHLDIVGELNAEQVALLSENGISWSNYFNVSDEKLIDLYATADILLFPSVYEGFGVPILEAQQTGRLVVTSNISPLKEVAGAGAELVDPYEPASIRSGLLRVINDEEYRSGLIRKGLENVRQYNSSAIATSYISIYHSLMDPVK